MNDCTIMTMNGKTTTLDTATLESFAGGLRGSIVTPDDSDYDTTRTIWNAMVDKKPGLIVRCAGTADVIRAVDLARENELLISVRGIGHNIAGNSVTDGGLMIDLSGMKSVRPDTMILPVSGSKTGSESTRISASSGSMVLPLESVRT